MFGHGSLHVVVREVVKGLRDVGSRAELLLDCSGVVDESEHVGVVQIHSGLDLMDVCSSLLFGVGDFFLAENDLPGLRVFEESDVSEPRVL